MMLRRKQEILVVFAGKIMVTIKNKLLTSAEIFPLPTPRKNDGVYNVFSCHQLIPKSEAVSSMFMLEVVAGPGSLHRPEN
jgi:hypothetical protein